MIEASIPLIDDILGSKKAIIGADFDGYRNHVYRMVNFCFAQQSLDAEQRQKVVIAGCFHDIGIWTANTFDYLPPSAEAAAEYLELKGLSIWKHEIGQMIYEHHKVRSVPSEEGRLAEVFRKADLVDFSLGLVKCGLPRATVREVKDHFPNAGFHKRLVRLAGNWICRHPLDPVPVLRW